MDFKSMMLNGCNHAQRFSKIFHDVVNQQNSVRIWIPELHRALHPAYTSATPWLYYYLKFFSLTFPLQPDFITLRLNCSKIGTQAQRFSFEMPRTIQWKPTPFNLAEFDWLKYNDLPRSQFGSRDSTSQPTSAPLWLCLPYYLFDFMRLQFGIIPERGGPPAYVRIIFLSDCY